MQAHFFFDKQKTPALYHGTTLQPVSLRRPTIQGGFPWFFLQPPRDTGFDHQGISGIPRESKQRIFLEADLCGQFFLDH